LARQQQREQAAAPPRGDDRNGEHSDGDESGNPAAPPSESEDEARRHATGGDDDGDEDNDSTAPPAKRPRCCSGCGTPGTRRDRCPTCRPRFAAAVRGTTPQAPARAATPEPNNTPTAAGTAAAGTAAGTAAAADKSLILVTLPSGKELTVRIKRTTVFSKVRASVLSAYAKDCPEVAEARLVLTLASSGVPIADTDSFQSLGLAEKTKVTASLA
jgi:hypothetical protein